MGESNMTCCQMQLPECLFGINEIKILGEYIRYLEKAGLRLVNTFLAVISLVLISDVFPSWLAGGMCGQRSRFSPHKAGPLSQTPRLTLVCHRMISARSAKMHMHMQSPYDASQRWCCCRLTTISVEKKIAASRGR